MVGRASRAIRRNGLLGAVRRARAVAYRKVSLDERHVWYELEPHVERPRPRLAPQFALRRGLPEDAPLIDELPTVPSGEARARMDAGHELWLVLDGEQPVFSCWIFRGSTPVIAAPGGELSLPAGHVCLEDSVTAASARGKGVAPAAWAAIADTLALEGVEKILTKIAVDNRSSRKAVEKVGFAAVAVMEFRRLASRSRASVGAIGKPSPAIAFYRERLGLDSGAPAVPARRLASRRSLMH